MSSSIFFKFKSQKEPSQITFDGTSLSVFEVKRDIIALSKLGDGTDFDLEINTSDTNERYDDDTVQIPRSTTVIARRLPATKPGAGRAARYVSGKMPVNAKNQHRVEAVRADPSKAASVASGPAASGKPMTEEEKLQAMFSENKASWAADQADIAAKGVNNRPFFPKQAAVPDKPPPPGYICHRCGEKGHWIQACPTNTDPNYDGRPKFRRTTGIPRSFLKVIEKPEAVDENGKIDVSQLPAGAMYTANGEWVIARPDEASWDKFQQTQKVAADQAKELEADKEVMRTRGLECSIDHKMFSDPVKTPCCAQIYCRTCIENSLIDSDFVCPNCGEQCLLESLESDTETLDKIKAFQEEMKAEKLKKQTEAEEASKKSPSVAPESPAKSKSPQPSDSRPGSSSGKKRAAEDELENTHKPAGPSEMKRAGSKEASPSQPKQPNVANANNSNNNAQPAPPVMPMAKNMQEFVAQMNSMAGMPGMPGGMNPAMMNPMMMGMNPMMMGGPGHGGMNPMMNPMMGPMGMGGMNGNMNGGFGFGPQGQQSFGGPNGGAAPPAGPRAWQQQQQQQPWGMNNGMNGMNNGMHNGMRSHSGTPQGPAADGGPYFRQPVNPGRVQNRGRRQRSVDYKQMGQ
ncbi:hypothetical protein Q7P37_010025 [Cladosporium fusiforme]